MQELERVQRLGDDVLIERLTQSVRGDRQLTVQMLIEMGEVQARELFRDLGFSSMFLYATRKLGMSESEAGLRLRVAKLGREFPIALELLGRGELNLSTLSILASVLKADRLGLLYEARGKTKEQVFELIARYAPKPDAPDLVRKLPSPRPSARAAQSRAKTASVMPLAVASTATAPAPATSASPSRAAEPPRETVRHRITFTANQHLRDLLSEAQDLLRHRLPNGELETIFEQALELLVAREKHRQFGLTDKPRAKRNPRPKRSRHIPYEIRREVYVRDGGQCCFVSPDGRRCCARGRLQYQHIEPYGRGGLTCASNVCLMCNAHNALLAERDYSRAWIRACIARQRTDKKEPSLRNSSALRPKIQSSCDPTPLSATEVNAVSGPILEMSRA